MVEVRKCEQVGIASYGAIWVRQTSKRHFRAGRLFLQTSSSCLPIGAALLSKSRSGLKRSTGKCSYRRAVGFLCAVILGVGVPICVGQEDTGSIAGVVKDPSGAVIEGASVSARNTATSVETKTIADGQGHYLFPSLAPGVYNLSTTHNGFSDSVISGINLNVNQHATVDMVLHVGSTAQTVTVQGSSPLVDTTSASLGTLVGGEAIVALPLNLREVGNLALLVPGTTNTTGRSLTSSLGNGSGFNDTSYSGSGGRSSSNLLLIDGMISRSLNNGSFALNPYPDVVGEFKIQNNVYDAQFGITSGTVMNLITHSGTNSLHGSVWEFLRNADLDAQNYFAFGQPRTEFNRNQFGGAIGGPILKNKLFFFGSYEGLRLTQGSSLLTNVPTAAEQSGDFSSYLTGTTHNVCAAGGPSNLNFDTGQLFDPGTEQTYVCPNSGNTVLIGTPVPGNKVSNINAPFAQKVLALFPAPNTSINGADFINTAPVRRTDDQADVRVDYNLGEKNRLFARYYFGNSNQIYPTALPAFASYQHFTGQNTVVGWTHIFSPTLLNDARIGYQRDTLFFSCSSCPRSPGTLVGMGIQGIAPANPSLDEYPNVLFTNFPAWGDGFPGYFPETLPDSLVHYSDAATKTIGRHTLTAGAELNYWNTNGLQEPAQANSLLSFNGQYSSLGYESPAVSTVSDLADLELGYPAGGNYTKNPIVNHMNGRWYSVFVQDAIHVSSNFSLEAGLRWEYRRQPVDKNNQLAAFFPLSKTYQPGDALLLTALPDSTNDALCSNPYFISATGACLIMSSTQRRQQGFNSNQVRQVSYGPGHGDFAPRLGISSRPFGSDRFVLHAGAGIFQDLEITNIFGVNNNNPVNTQFPVYVTAIGSPPPLTNGLPTTSETLFSSNIPLTLSGSSVDVMPSPYYHTSTVYQWSASIQSQLAQNMALEVAYVGNHGLHLNNLHLVGNQPYPGVGPLGPRRPWPDFQSLFYTSSDTYSHYDSLTVKLEKRASHGLSGLVAYTYGKSLDDTSGDSDFASFTQDDNNPQADYGVSDFSIRQTLVVSGIYQLPFGEGRPYLSTGGITNAIVGGWDVAAIVTLATGNPFTVLSAEDYSNTGSLSPRPDRTCGGQGMKAKTDWFDTSCFTTTALAQDFANGTPRFGESGRNILTGPGTFGQDVSLIKRFNLPERVHAEFRGEFFNALNHTNLALPNATLGAFGYNEIFTANAAREIQLGLKLSF